MFDQLTLQRRTNSTFFAYAIPEQLRSKFTLAEFPFLVYFGRFNDKSEEWETEFNVALATNQFF
jgi:hypothetical protein